MTTPRFPAPNALPPAGLVDRLPHDVRLRSALSASMLEGFASWGYERVVTPAFERADALERGLEVDPASILRFVDPAIDQVVLLRPDLTPQIARIVATHLSERPLPIRISYHGTVLRQTMSRSETSRQREQLGVELVGRRGMQGDLEILRLAKEATRRAGIEESVLELQVPEIGRRLLDEIAEDVEAQAQIAAALNAKDERTLHQLVPAKGAGAFLRDLVAMRGLVSEVLPLAKKRFARRKSDRALLDALAALVHELGDENVLVDLGEVRGRSYYTGMSFAILARGTGGPIARGGRYDRLIGRFGFHQPAVGFAFDLDHLIAASSAANELPAPGGIDLVCTDETLAARLRQECALRVATCDSGAEEYARAVSARGFLQRSTIVRLMDSERRGIARAKDTKFDAGIKTWLRAEA